MKIRLILDEDNPQSIPTEITKLATSDEEKERMMGEYESARYISLHIKRVLLEDIGQRMQEVPTSTEEMANNSGYIKAIKRVLKLLP